MAPPDDEAECSGRVSSMTLNQDPLYKETQVSTYHFTHETSSQMEGIEVSQDAQTDADATFQKQGSDPRSDVEPWLDEMTVDSGTGRDADSGFEKTTVDHTAKRNADSLFVRDDEPTEETDTRSSKRMRLERDSTYASSSDKVSQKTTPPVEDSTSPAVPYQDMISPQAPTLSGRPRLAIYHPGFEKAQSAVTAVCNEFIQHYDAMKATGYTNDTIDYIIVNNLQRWRSPAMKFPSVQPVVLLGPAGVGKSSGANCYLDKTGAAIESDSGDRGTSIVHEYSSTSPNQTAAYRVSPRYRQPRQILSIVEEYCRAIFEFRHASREADEELDESEKKELKARHDMAMEFFTTLLCDREEFDTEDGEPDFFDDFDPDSDPRDVAKQLVGFVEDLLRNKGVLENNMTESFEAENEEELNNIFRSISGKQNEGDQVQQPSTWPLIVKNEVHFNNDLLNAGVLLADAPGVTDLNRIVVQNTRQYLKGAGTILVFSEPTRIKSSVELDTNLRECIRLGKMEHTYLIVTMIDNKTAFKPAEKGALLPRDREKLEDAQREVERRRAECESLAQAMHSTTNLDEYRSKDREVKEMELAVKEAEMMITQVSIEIRNQSIERAVVSKFREISGSRHAPDLKVIFTSNSEYQKHLKGIDRKNPPKLDLNATGIPKVKDMLYRVPARGKTNTLARIIDTHLPSVFNGIIGALTKSHLERKSEVANQIATVLEGQIGHVTLLVKELKSFYKGGVEKTFGDNEASWRKAAESKLADWSEFKPITFAAFCRKEGEWRSNKGANEMLNWNFELQGILAPKVNAAFDSFEEEIDSLESGLVTSITAVYQRLKDVLEGCEAFQGADEKPFFDQIDHMQDVVTGHMEKLLRKFKSQLNVIRNSITLPGEDNYITPVMQVTYDACAKMTAKNHPPAPGIEVKDKRGRLRKKTGVHPARVEAIRKKFAGEGEVPSLFFAVSYVASDAFRELLNAFEGKWRARVTWGNAEVLKDFNARFDTPEVKNEENPEAVESLKHAAKVALDTIQGEVKDWFEESMAYEKAGAVAM